MKTAGVSSLRESPTSSGALRSLPSARTITCMTASLFFDPATGEPLRDDEPTLRGLDVQLGALKLRAKILGLDAPQKHHLVNENGNTIDITRLVPLLRVMGITGEDDDDYGDPGGQIPPGRPYLPDR